MEVFLGATEILAGLLLVVLACFAIGAVLINEGDHRERRRRRQEDS